jgi:hypothetical protein
MTRVGSQHKKKSLVLMLYSYYNNLLDIPIPSHLQPFYILRLYSLDLYFNITSDLPIYAKGPFLERFCLTINL